MNGGGYDAFDDPYAYSGKDVLKKACAAERNSQGT